MREGKEYVDKKNILYRNCDDLAVMETLNDNEYDLVYLDVPYFTRPDDMLVGYEQDSISDVKRYLAEKKGCQITEISKEEIKTENLRRQNENKQIKLKEYREYIGHVIENAKRILTEDGVLCFLAPAREYVDINYKLILDQFFSVYETATVERRKSITTFEKLNNNHDTLYFYSKNSGHVFAPILELGDIADFPKKDERGNYRLMPLLNHMERKGMDFEWRGITPSGKSSWRYQSDKLNDLYEDNRIEIAESGRPFLKYYRHEHPMPISSVWKSEERLHLRGCYSLASNCMERIIINFSKEESKIFCPFDRDGKFSFLCNENGRCWVSVFRSAREDEELFIDKISKDDYEIIDVIENTRREYENVVTSASDIEKLKSKLNELTNSVKQIKLSVGIDSDGNDAEIDDIIERIHSEVSKALSQYSIKGSIPEAQAWLNPYWDKLEPESKHFIPTGVLMYNQFSGEDGVDMAPIMIEYCKSLEKELFQKMFYGYVKSLIQAEVDVSSKFKDAFQEEGSAVFANFLLDCTTKYVDCPSEWKFEIGKMRIILQQALAKKPKGDLMKDFRAYLDTIFEHEFFRKKFMDRLSQITKIRNTCAHPSILPDDKVNGTKDLIREKLLLILEYYKYD